MSGKEFSNKVVIVTGSSGGIGREIALEFGRQGASLTIHGTSEDKLCETKNQLVKEGVPAGSILTVLGQIQERATAERLVNETVKRFGHLDVLVNNAGLMAKPNEPPNSLASFDHVFNINVRAVVQLVELAIPHLEKSGGNVVNIGSGLSVKPSPFAMCYSMSKAAIDQYTRCAANLFAAKGVRVNSVK